MCTHTRAHARTHTVLALSCAHRYGTMSWRTLCLPFCPIFIWLSQLQRLSFSHPNFINEALFLLTELVFKAHSMKIHVVLAVFGFFFSFLHRILFGGCILGEDFKSAKGLKRERFVTMSQLATHNAHSLNKHWNSRVWVRLTARWVDSHQPPSSYILESHHVFIYFSFSVFLEIDGRDNHCLGPERHLDSFWPASINITGNTKLFPAKFAVGKRSISPLYPPKVRLNVSNNFLTLSC